MKNDLSFCASEVKNNDYYRYICCLFTPEILRVRLFTLYAFNNEIAKIKELVSEPMPGLIRLTWWREAIDEIYNNKPPRNHEVVKSLYELIKTTDLPRSFLEKIIDARETDLEFLPPNNLEDLKKYLDGTSVALLHASLHVIGVNKQPARDAANYIGIAYALIGIMRRAKWDAAKKHVMFPMDMLEKQGINMYDIAEGLNLDKTKVIVKQLCDKVEVNLRHAKALHKDLPKKALPIYLHSIIASCFLRRIIKNDYDLFNTDLERGRLGIIIKLFYASATTTNNCK